MDIIENEEDFYGNGYDNLDDLSNDGFGDLTPINDDDSDYGTNNPPSNFNDNNNNDDEDLDNQNNDNQSNNDDSDDSDDFLLDLLKARGIDDYEKIEFEDNLGNTVVRSWNDLSRDEQIEILSDTSVNDEDQLSEQEEEVLSFIRTNRLDLDAYKNHIKNEIIKELQVEYEAQSTIDNINDDVLYQSYLMSIYRDCNEEFIAFELEKEKADPERFATKMQYIRRHFEELEANEKKRKFDEDNLRQLQIRESAKNNFKNAVNNNKVIGGLEVETSRADDLVSYIYDAKADNMSDFTKDIADPNKLFKIAYLAKYSDEIFNTLHKYYQDKIEDLNKPSKNNKNNQKSRTIKGNTTKQRSKSNDGWGNLTPIK